MNSKTVTIHLLMKATKQYFPAVLFIMLYMFVNLFFLHLKPVDEIR